MRLLIGLGAVGLDPAPHRLAITDSGDLLAVGAGCTLSGATVNCACEPGATKLITSIQITVVLARPKIVAPRATSRTSSGR